MMTRRTAIVGAVIATSGTLGAATQKTNTQVPDHFASYEDLEIWAKDCFGGGSCTKFVTS